MTTRTVPEVTAFLWCILWKEQPC